MQVELEAVEDGTNAVPQHLFLLAGDIVVIIADIALARGVEAGRTDAEQLDRRSTVQGRQNLKGLTHNIRHTGEGRFQFQDILIILVYSQHAVIVHILCHETDTSIQLACSTCGEKDISHFGLEDRKTELCEQTGGCRTAFLKMQYIIP